MNCKVCEREIEEDECGVTCAECLDTVCERCYSIRELPKHFGMTEVCLDCERIAELWEEEINA